MTNKKLANKKARSSFEERAFELVELGGVEPPSAKPPSKNLHAYLVYSFNQNATRPAGITLGEFVNLMLNTQTRT